VKAGGEKCAFSGAFFPWFRILKENEDPQVQADFSLRF
jgi:hypothetical protein